MGDLVGYGRVSTKEQNLDGQMDQLTAAGCVKIFTDKITGKSLGSDRAGWNKLMAYVRPGDTIVVCELSRMSRSLLQFLSTVQSLEKQGINIKSLRENIDPTTATGRAFMAMMGVIHQLELDLKAERAAAGRSAAKARGKTGGRPRADQDKLEQAKVLYENTDKSAAEVCKNVGIGRRTLFNYIAKCKEVAGIGGVI